MFAFVGRYQRIRAGRSSGSTPEHCENFGGGDQSDRQHSIFWLSLWPLTLCLLCTLLNVALYHLSRDLPDTRVKNMQVTEQDIYRLRRPSQYIRLDEITRPSPPTPRQFDNYPIVVVQVDSLHQDRVIDSESNKHMVYSGNILPLERHVYVSETVSTVIQFRAIDYGMEKCELKLALYPESLLQISPVPFELEIFRLNATIPLNGRTINWRKRPTRVSKVASIPVVPTKNVTWHRIFSCPSDDVLTFELGCRAGIEESGCRVEWWQNKTHIPAIFITQHSTI